MKKAFLVLIITIFSVAAAGCSKIEGLKEILGQDQQEETVVVHITDEQKAESADTRDRWDVMRLRYEKDKAERIAEEEAAREATPTPSPEPTPILEPLPTDIPEDFVETEVRYIDAKYPEELVKGQSFNICGTISPEEGYITKISGYFVNQDGDIIMSIVDDAVNSKEYELKRSKIDYGMVFGILDVGEYTGIISSEGTLYKEKEVAKFQFKVNPRPEIKKSREEEEEEQDQD